MSSIFILGLSDQYTKEKLFPIPAKEGKSTVEFDDLVRAACEIQQAKDNCLEAGGHLLVAFLVSNLGEENPRKVPVTDAIRQNTANKGFLRMLGKSFAALIKRNEKMFADGAFHRMLSPSQGSWCQER
jgi:hypothetical protein